MSERESTVRAALVVYFPMRIAVLSLIDDCVKFAKAAS
jgi:hypothetical protein